MDSYLTKALQGLVYALLVVTPLTWTSATSELFELPKMFLTYGFVIVIAALWISRMIVQKQLIFTKTSMDLPIVLFVISQILATILSIDPHTSIFGYYSRFHGGLLSTITYSVLFFAITANFSIKHVTPLLLSLFTGAFLASSYAIPEHFGHSPSCLAITGNFDVSCWVQDVQTRVFATFGQPNWLAAYIITIIFIPLLTALLPTTSSIRPLSSPKNLGLLGFAAVLFITLLFTKSRSGILGFAAGAGLAGLWILLIRKTLGSKANMLARRTSIAVVGLLLLFVLFGKGIVPQFDRLFTPPTTTQPAPEQSASPAGTQLEVGGTESGDIRKIVWTGALELVRQNPLFGTGVETFAYSYYNVRPTAHNNVSEWDFLYNKAHNELLNIAANSGLIGLGTYLYMLGMFYHTTSKKIRQKSTKKSTKVGLIALQSGLLGLTVSNVLGFSTVMVGILMYLWFALSAILFKKPSKRTPAGSLGLGQYILLAITVIFAATLLSATHRMLRADLAFAQGKKYRQSQQVANALVSLESATRLRPGEPTYTDQLAFTTAQAASLLQASGEATQAALLKDQAIALSDYTLSLTDDHLNFYKTRARTFIQLTSIDPNLLEDAKQTLIAASTLSPTDPKLVYNLGLLEYQQQNYQTALEYLNQSISLKPDYIDPRITRGDIYLVQGQDDLAAEEYTYILENLKPNDTVVIEKLNQVSNQ